MNMDYSYPVGSFTTGTARWQARFSSVSKLFYATAEGYPEIRGSNWATLVSNARARYSQSKVKVNLPYAYFSERAGEYALEKGIATGIHSAYGSILVIENGTPGLLNRHGHRAIRPPSEDDAARLLYLLTQIHRLEAERIAITRKYEFKNGLHSAVTQAVEEARHQLGKEEARQQLGKEEEETGTP